MDVIEAIHARHSVRSFTAEPVSDDMIDLLVKAAAAAPSAQNSQPWYFHVATGETRRRVGELIALTTVHLSEYVDMLGPEGVKLAEKFYADLGGAPIVIALSVPKADDETWRTNEYLVGRRRYREPLARRHGRGPRRLQHHGAALGAR